jgi:hypothetical protein
VSLSADSGCAGALVNEGASGIFARMLAERMSDAPPVLERRLVLLSNLIVSAVGKGEARGQRMLLTARTLLAHPDADVRRAAVWLMTVWARDGMSPSPAAVVGWV